jgi:hypothetical protein
VIERVHHLFETRPFTAKRLGAFWIVPDVRVFQLANDLRQAFLFTIEVKGTP